MRIKLGGYDYTVRFVPHVDGDFSHVISNGRRFADNGACWKANDESPTGIIEVRDDLAPKKELEITVHEAIHAIQPSADEDTVERTAKDLARLLWRLGYRKGERE